MDWTIRLAHPARFEYIQEGAPLLKTRSLGDMVVVEIGWKTDFLVQATEKDYNPFASKRQDPAFDDQNAEYG